MIKWVLVLLSAVYSFAGTNYCDLLGYRIYADDAAAHNGVATYLGDISTSTSSSTSIINSVGDYGSKFSSTSIYNSFGDFGSAYSSYSAFNNVTSTPPRIIEYRAATNSYYNAGYVTTNSVSYPNVNPDDLRSVLLHGNCEGFGPIVHYDTVKVTFKDTVLKIDTLKIHDTTKTIVHDTTKLIVHDTTNRAIHDTLKLTLHDTTKVAIHDTTKVTLRDTLVKIDTLIFKDTVKYCPQPPTLTKFSALSYKPSVSTTVYSATGKPEWNGLLPLGELPPIALKDGLYIIIQGDQTRRLQVIHK